MGGGLGVVQTKSSDRSGPEQTDLGEGASGHAQAQGAARARAKALKAEGGGEHLGEDSPEPVTKFRGVARGGSLR